MPQEALSEYSSRTYVSTLERGKMSPTLEKIDQLAEMLEVHPLTMLVLAYAGSAKAADVERVLDIVNHELKVFCTPAAPSKGG